MTAKEQLEAFVKGIVQYVYGGMKVACRDVTAEKSEFIIAKDSTYFFRVYPVIGGMTNDEGFFCQPRRQVPAILGGLPGSDDAGWRKKTRQWAFCQ